MRLAFWRKNKDDVPVAKAVAVPVTPSAPEAPSVPVPALKPTSRVAPAMAPSGDLDIRQLGDAMRRRKAWILIPTAIAAVLSIAAVNLITPRYKSEARILIDGRENIFLRPTGERNEERTSLDPEAVTSQVQLLLSRDLAREIIKKNKHKSRFGNKPGDLFNELAAIG